MSILETHALTRRYGPRVVVDALTLAVEAGEVFGLLGPNGAGKTTTIKMLTTLLPPSSGGATLAGFDVVRQAAEVRRVIGYVPQLLSADGALTGYENLLIFAKLYELPRAGRKERVRDALAFMGLQDAADRLVNQYSGGMIRRLEIAQAMLHRPRVLILDEPTTGLDPLGRAAVWDHLDRLRTATARPFSAPLTSSKRPTPGAAAWPFCSKARRPSSARRPPSRPRSTSRGRPWTTCSSVTPAARWTPGGVTVTSQEAAAPPSGSADPSPPRRGGPLRGLLRFTAKTLVFSEYEARKLRHDPTELLTRALQPALWLLVFGQVFGRTRVIPTGNLPYLDYLAPGVLAQSVLFIAIFYGIAVIWERDLGIVHKLLASPTPRSALVLGKAVSAGLRALSQAIIIYALAWLMGVRVEWNPLCLVGVLAAVVLGAAAFSTFSLIIACLVKTRERFMGIGQVLTMPLFFASNAIYPVAMMPPWLQVLSQVNPLTYQVDALRSLMVVGGASAYGLGLDFLVLLATTTALVVVGARLYPRLVV